MKATFLKDEHNRIWLFYADEIKVRRRTIKARPFNPRVDYFQTINADSFIRQVDFNKVDVIYSAMERNYELLRKKSGMSRDLSFESVLQSPVYSQHRLNEKQEVRENRVKLSKTVLSTFNGGRKVIRNFASNKTGLYQQSFHKSLFRSGKSTLGLNS
eukprot:TRINITY_DN5450_c0_g1_i6.p2 TRINITY_DN5450_c0_g1~~TRINITY_DN5450_c0_g1_i6.p2  ORF type:complete len:157 (+),score=38.65 TRINITY_DN5450_c0_g1_i6:1083-1553(+)